MRLVPGEKVKNIILPEIGGSVFELESVAGQAFMLSFFRFASCPLCNLRMDEMVKRFYEFGEDFTIIAVFDSSFEKLVRHTDGHEAPFHVLADEKNIYYREYGIEHSLYGLLKGMVLRFPTLLKGVLKGYFPREFKKSLFTMPADFLVDREGIIREVHYGADEGDHTSFDQVKEFALRALK